MKEVLAQYASYHLWANERLLKVVLGLEDNKHQEVVASSFPGLYATFLHIGDAEIVCWQRMKMQ